MPTLSFHAPAAAGRKIRAAARQRRIPVSRFLREAAEAAAAGSPATGLGRELERLAIDGMALMALERTRARAKATGLDRLTDAAITAEIKAHRRERRGGA
jgi:hypothetical protein